MMTPRPSPYAWDNSAISSLGVLLEQPAWWVGFFQDLVDKQGQLTDPNLAKVLIIDGRKALERQDIDALRQV